MRNLRVGLLVTCFFARVPKLLMLALIVILAMPLFASAATFTVNSTIDRVDNNLRDNICHTGFNVEINGVPQPECTLRAAIMQTNSNLSGPVPDTIILPRGLYRLTILDTPAVDNIGATGDLDIVQSLNIVGAGSGVTIIDGNLCTATQLQMGCTPQNASRNVSRIFHIVRPSGTPTVQISGVTIQNAGGVERGFLAPGGAIAIGVGARLVLRDTIITKSKAGTNGGGIHNQGDLFIFDSKIIDNVLASDDSGGGGIDNLGRLFISASTIDGNESGSAGGGGIRNSGGTVRIEESTVSRNKSIGGNGGGGIFNSGRLEIENSTISGNIQGSARSQGGGIYNRGGEVFLLNATITNNSTFSEFPGLGGGISNELGRVLLANTIIAGNCNGGKAFDSPEIFCAKSQRDARAIDRNADLRSDCAGTLESQGFNLLGTSQNPGTNPAFTRDGAPLPPCVFENMTGDPDRIDVQDPRLGLLEGNGGLTETHALLAGSPAINSGSSRQPGFGFGCIPFDQRLLPRPFGARCDIGAFEFGVINVPECTSLPGLCLEETQQITSSDPTPVPGGPAGTVTITQTFSNNREGNVPISNLVFEVTLLTNGNLVLNADAFRGRRGVGARISAPPNQVLSPGKSITVDFVIGRQTPDDFDLGVDVLGAPRVR